MNTPWILILNGSSSVGKTTIAREYISTYNTNAKLLQIDTEIIPVFIEALEKHGYHYNQKIDFWTWFENLTADIKEQINSYEKELFIEAYRRMIEKAKEFYGKGINVIIDAVLLEYEGESYTCFKKAFEDLQTFFIFVYAPINKVLENVTSRNIPGEAAEKRSVLDPFALLFGHLCKKCNSQSHDILEILTKQQLDDLFDKLKALIDQEPHVKSHKLTELERFEKMVNIVNQKFLNQHEQTIGICPKYSYDLILDTGITSPSKCTAYLDKWIKIQH